MRKYIYIYKIFFQDNIIRIFNIQIYGNIYFNSNNSKKKISKMNL